MALGTVRRLGRALLRRLAREDGRPRAFTYAAWSAQRTPTTRDLDEQRRRSGSLAWTPSFDVVVVCGEGETGAALRTSASIAAQTYRKLAIHECPDAS
ncbi:MAG TPA: hypothetical protein VE964_10305, partial [Myxococcales bacterium]|nr:hypothetical protein [Myxococcales bacterium]